MLSFSSFDEAKVSFQFDLNDYPFRRVCLRVNVYCRLLVNFQVFFIIFGNDTRQYFRINFSIYPLVFQFFLNHFPLVW